MNANQVRYYLHNFNNLKKEIEYLRSELEDYKKMDSDRVGASKLTDMPKCHGNGSIVESSVMQLPVIILGLIEEISCKMTLISAIERVILYLPPKREKIINMRYFKKENDLGMNWAEIAESMNITEEYAKQIDREVILKIMNVLLDKSYILPEKRKEEPA